MGKVGKRVKKENENLATAKDVLKEELIRLKDELDSVKKDNRCYFEKIKEMQKEKCKLLEENYDLEKNLGKVKVKNEELEEKLKRNEEFEQRVKLFDEIKKKNEDLEEKLGRLEEENICLKSKPLVSDVSCDTKDL